MNKAMKYATKHLTRLGATIEHESPMRLTFRLPNGTVWECRNTATEKQVREVVGRLRDWQTAEHDYLGDFRWLRPMPSLADKRLVRTSHFSDRVELMTSQGMRVNEVRDALVNPTSVRVSYRDSLLYCRGRVAVAVRVKGDTARAVTVLWTTRALWRLNPRRDLDAL